MQNRFFFNKDQLLGLKNRTPFFVFSKGELIKNLSLYRELLPPNTEICYAMKANSEKVVLQTLYENGVSFEVASKYELALLKAHKVLPERIVYGTSVKPESHIKEFYKYGVRRFACDSEEELIKISKYAPGSRIYIRVDIKENAESVFTMSEKFGAPPTKVVSMFLKAKDLNLIPYGISFNVGSQAKKSQAWANGIIEVAEIMRELLEFGIRLDVVNIGGGFPQSYQPNDGYPSIQEISAHINSAIKQLPYTVNILVEPGRALVASAFSLITSVIGKNKRSNGHWLYLDVGVYNAMLESMTCQGSTKYLIEPLKIKNKTKGEEEFILTGPTGDNLDVINSSQILPSSINKGDKLIVHDVGAYTFPLITNFNGFPKPKIVER